MAPNLLAQRVLLLGEGLVPMAATPFVDGTQSDSLYEYVGSAPADPLDPAGSARYPLLGRAIGYASLGVIPVGVGAVFGKDVGNVFAEGTAQGLANVAQVGAEMAVASIGSPPQTLIDTLLENQGIKTEPLIYGLMGLHPTPIRLPDYAKGLFYDEPESVHQASKILAEVGIVLITTGRALKGTPVGNRPLFGGPRPTPRVSPTKAPGGAGSGKSGSSSVPQRGCAPSPANRPPGSAPPQPSPASPNKPPAKAPAAPSAPTAPDAVSSANPTKAVTAPIDFDGHILNAEVKANGKVVGGHSTATGKVKVIQGSATAPDSTGVYKAKIEVADPNNPGRFLAKTNNQGYSTMFPDSWSADRVKTEVDAAFRNRILNGDKWSGTTPSGVKVEGYLTPKTTVYPIYEP